MRRDGPSLDAVSRAMANACHFGPDDHVLAAVPLCHSYGLEARPARADLRRKLRTRLREVRSGGGPERVPQWPNHNVSRRAIHVRHAGAGGGAAFPTLRRAYSAGGPLPRATFDAFHARSGLQIGQVYGATEIGSVTFNDPNSIPFDPASVGVPMEGVEIRILDSTEPNVDQPLPTGIEGQVAIAARSMMSGYIDGQTAPLLDGYYLTGDLGMLNDFVGAHHHGPAQASDRRRGTQGESRRGGSRAAAASWRWLVRGGAASAQ